MKKTRLLPFIICLIVGLILHIALGIYLVEDWIFGDSWATPFEQVMYHMAVIPPFIIAVLFYKETGQLLKSLLYSVFFYAISFIIVMLYHSVPTATNYPAGTQVSLGSYGFYVTGGGMGPLAVLPHILLTVGLLLLLNHYKN